MSSQLVLALLGLLEKAAVLATAAFLLSLVRPFQRVVTAHWSPRRAVALIGIFSVISVSGSHLNVAVLDLRPDLRAIGVLTAGFLGGWKVGLAVGAAGGSWFAFVVRGGGDLWPFFLSASLLDGVLAGWIGRRRTLDRLPLPVAFGWAVGIQAAHLAALGSLLAATRPQVLGSLAGRLLQAIPEVAGNALGVTLFVLILRTALQSTAREVALSRQEAAVAQARLMTLQAQIRPHFLYNTLNTIAYLVRTKPDEARALLQRLADLYRRTLRDIPGDAPLADELDTVERYLEIERARFGDRLRVEIDATPEARAALVPPLLLQPLVENAVQHGISPKPEGGRLAIRARTADEGLTIDVSDDGVGFDPAVRPFGVGLTNVAQRLAARAAPGALIVDTRPGGGATVGIRIPLPAPAPP